MFDRLTAGVVLVVVLMLGGYGVKSILDERNQLREKVQEQQVYLKLAEQVQSTTSTVLSERVQTAAAIKTKAKNVTSEILQRLPVAPADCQLSGDWRLLHDSATSVDEVPTATGGTDAQTVTPQQAALTVTSNYEIALDNADRLDKLQQWIEGINK